MHTFKFRKSNEFYRLRISKEFLLLFISLFSSLSILPQDAMMNKSSHRDSIVKYNYKDSARTKYFIEDYISHSKRNKDYKNLFDAYHAMASFYYQYNDTLKLVEYTDKLFSVAKNNNLKIELLKGYHLKNNALTMISGLGDQRIFGHIYEALKIAKEIESTVWERKYYDDLASYYEITGDFEKALGQYRDNLTVLKRIAESADYKKFKMWGGSIEKTYLALADIFISLREVDSAKIYNKMAKSVLDSTVGKYHAAYCYTHKIHEVEINLLEDKIELAKKNLGEAIAIAPETNKKSFNANAEHYYSGLISYHEGDFDKAIRSFEAIDTISIQSFERAGYFDNDFYKILYKSYLKNNDLKKADYFFDKHLASLRGKININNSVYSNLKDLEISRYNEEVEALKSKSSKQRIILVLISFISLFITILVVVLFRKKQKKNQEKLALLLERIERKKTHKKLTPVPLKINDKEVQRIIKKIHELEDMRYYLKNDCTLPNLAKKLKTNTTYLSKIFNTHYQKRFNTYINELRIDFIIEKLNSDNQFRNYTIKSLANEVGFKSKESFNSAFKKRTGVLPSTLIKELSKQKDGYLGDR